MKNFNEEKESLIFKMFKETAELYKNVFIANQTELLSNEVEFWKWLRANYPKNFTNKEVIKNQILNNSDWLNLQIQGKGYEWDFVSSQRENIKNLFSKYELGKSPTQKGIDITKKNIFTDEVEKTFQNKAYTGKTNPNLKNTPNDTIVVTGTEKVKYAQNKGYETKEFMNSEEILKSRNERIDSAFEGKANLNYNVKNVASTMGKAGVVGFIIGMGVETIVSYKKWKKGEITTDDYLKEILRSGGQSGINGAMTAGIMIPISAKIIVLGASKIINFPVAIAISITLDKIIAPAFGRGKYKEYLNEAKYYQNLDYFFKDFTRALLLSKESYEKFIFNMLKQEEVYKILLQKNKFLSKKTDDSLGKFYEGNNELEELLIKISGGKK